MIKKLAARLRQTTPADQQQAWDAPEDEQLLMNEHEDADGYDDPEWSDDGRPCRVRWMLHPVNMHTSWTTCYLMYTQILKDVKRGSP